MKVYFQNNSAKNSVVQRVSRPTIIDCTYDLSMEITLICSAMLKPDLSCWTTEVIISGPNRTSATSCDKFQSKPHSVQEYLHVIKYVQKYTAHQFVKYKLECR